VLLIETPAFSQFCPHDWPSPQRFVFTAFALLETQLCRLRWFNEARRMEQTCKKIRAVAIGTDAAAENHERLSIGTQNTIEDTSDAVALLALGFDEGANQIGGSTSEFKRQKLQGRQIRQMHV
jgi:hypothetical protein